MSNAPKFTVTAHPHPLRSEYVQGQLDVGHSLADLGVGGCVLAYIDGELQSDLAYQPAEGQHVEIRVAPAGDGDSKGALRLAATVAVIAASYGIAGPELAGTWGVGATGWGAGLALAGQLALNALIPPPSQNLDASAAALQPFRRISGNNNQAQPFGVIPRLYGTHRTYPPLAAAPYSEQVGADQYVRMLFCLGYGPLTIDTASFKIGDTLLSEYEAETEVREGTPSDAPITLYSRNVVETSLNDPFDTDGTSVVRTSAAGSGITALSLDIIAPALLDATGTGAFRQIAVGFKVEFKKSTDSTWTLATPSNSTLSGDGGYSSNFPLKDGGPAGATVLTTPTINSYDDAGHIWTSGAGCYYLIGSDVRAFVANISIPVTDSGAHDVRITRIAAVHLGTIGTAGGRAFISVRYLEPNDSRFSEFAWVALRSIGGDIAQSVPAGLAFVAMRIKVTDQLSGTIDNFSCVASARIQAWTGSAWVEQVTSNPAWIYRDILLGSANARPLDPSRLDDAALKAWGAECAASGREFNGVFDGRTTVFDALSSVAACGRGAFQIRDGLYSIVRDTPGLAPVQLFTPRNSSNFSGSKVFAKQPHALKIKFKDRDNDWVDAERVVYADGYSFAGGGGMLVATEFDSLSLFGVTSATQAWKDGRYHQAVATLRSETFRWKASIDNLVSQRGDVVRYQHDAIKIGLGAARITAIAGSSITVDEQLEVLSGKTYQVMIRKDTGAQVTATITNGVGITNTLTLSGGVPPGVKVGDLAAIGESNSVTLDLLVTSVAPAEDLTAIVTAVAYAPGVFTADAGTVPDWTSGDPISGTPPAPIFLNVLAGPEAATRTNDGTLIPRIVASYTFPSTTVQIPNVEGAYRRASDTTFTSIGAQPNSGTVIFMIPSADSDYVIRLRGISPGGTLGPWAEYTVPANDAVPEPIEGLTLIEQPNNPQTPNGDLSTVIATVAPPYASTTYSYSIIEYRRVSQTAWFIIGPTDENNQARVVLNSDGSTYEFRARAVSVTGFQDASGPTAQITLSIASGEVPDPDDGATPLDALDVANLRLYGQLPSVTDFTGANPTFQWDAVTPPAGSTLRDYRVEIIDPATSEVMHRVYVVQPQFMYSLGQNTTDSAALGYSGPRRSFTVEVVARTVQGGISAHTASKTFTNPPPELPGDFSYVAFFTQIELSFSRPTDGDYVKAQIYMGTATGFPIDSAHLVYDGAETTPIDIFNVADGVTFYFRVQLYDVFGPGDLSSEYNVATSALPGNDTTPPSVPTGLALDTAVQSSQLWTISSVTASWDASTDDSGALYYELEYWTTDPAQTTVVQTTDTTYTVLPATPGVTYNFHVRGSDYATPDQNKSDWSSTVSIAVAADTTAPSNISGATASPGLDKNVLSWTNPSDQDFLEVLIFRGTSAGFTADGSSLIARTRASSYVDAKVVNGTAYYYKFATSDASGNTSAPSSAVGPATPVKIDNINVDDFIADGGLLAAKLAVGSPTNVIWNSTFGDESFGTLDGWGNGGDDGTVGLTGITLTVEDTVTGMQHGARDATLSRGTLATNEFMYALWAPANDWDAVLPVTPGERIQFSVYAQAHRLEAYAVLEFFDATGVPNANPAGDNITLIGGSAGGGWLDATGGGARNTLSAFTRIGKIATVPAGANYARAYIRCKGKGTATGVGGANALCYFTNAFLGRAQPNQTQLDPFAPGGITLIGGGVIRTRSIDASKIIANSITAAEIAAATITADRMNVSQLSAIAADLGSITAGTITGALIRTAASSARVQLDSSNGLQTYNSGGTLTAKLAPNGSGQLGAAGSAISWTSAGVVTVPGGLITTGTIVGPLFQTTGTWKAEMGAQSLNLDGDGTNTYVFAYRNGSSSRFRMDQSGNIRMQGRFLAVGASGRKIDLNPDGELIYYDTNGTSIIASIGVVAGGTDVVALFGSKSNANIYARTGVASYSKTNNGIYGESDSNAGVYGLSNTDIGVEGASSTGYGIECSTASFTAGASLRVYSQPSTQTGSPSHTAKAGSIVCRKKGSGTGIPNKFWLLYLQMTDDGSGSGSDWFSVGTYI